MSRIAESKAAMAVWMSDSAVELLALAIVMTVSSRVVTAAFTVLEIFGVSDLETGVHGCAIGFGLGLNGGADVGEGQRRSPWS